MVGTNDPLRKKAILAARFCVESLFRHKGRIPGKMAGEGLDCVGLVLYVGRQIGYVMEDWPYYTAVPRPGQLESAAREAGLQPVARDHLKPGDIVLIRPGRHVQHAGILTERGLIHADARLGRVVEQSLSAFDAGQITHHFRYPVLGD
ncbi:NlpC/P60 family protein [Emcibacter sp.]|uniref:NlpC/P60 family protein n=1 Tax=Emcibacter sp. TaxID=1979954 RepID=UPI003A8DFFBC